MCSGTGPDVGATVPMTAGRRAGVLVGLSPSVKGAEFPDLVSRARSAAWALAAMATFSEPFKPYIQNCNPLRQNNLLFGALTMMKL